MDEDKEEGSWWSIIGMIILLALLGWMEYTVYR